MNYDEVKKLAETLTKKDMLDIATKVGCWACGKGSDNLWQYHEIHGVPAEEQLFCFPCLKLEVAEREGDEE